ncbi:MAG: DNA-binding domain-containing protein [Candidatus Rokuibacteriota bacterium]
MPPLPELQAAFGCALLDPDAAMPPGVLGDGLAPRARVQIYRHHVLTSLTQALKDTYPVVCRLVDERFFAFAADRYIRACPPTGPCLFEYGSSFPPFLAQFPPCADLAYLPDVARLEWAINAALHALDNDPIDPAWLARVPAADVTKLTVRLHPSLSFIDSAWPIDRIWQANQPEADPDLRVDLGAGGVKLEVRRCGDDVVFRALAPAVYTLRRALADGRDLADAAEAALAAEPDFDLGVALRDLLDETLIVDLMLPP